MNKMVNKFPSAREIRRLVARGKNVPIPTSLNRQDGSFALEAPIDPCEIIPKRAPKRGAA